MKIFLSWSGDRAKEMALALKTWLPDVIQAIDPWVSPQDIMKGSRALRDIADELSESRYGIICVTPENQSSPWVNFEAGALSKEIDESLVSPFLLDMGVAELTGPLAQFQATESGSKADVKKLMHDINAALKDSGIPTERLDRAFERYWPDLDSALEKIRKETVSQRSSHSSRSNADMLAELLVLVRQQERRIADIQDGVRFTQRAARRVTVERSPIPISVLGPQRELASGKTRDNLRSLTLAELQALAEELGLRGTVRMRKSQLIAALEDKIEVAETDE
ncbi:Rho termination factor N-terminal domain-containing protein [Streptomyces sp. NPDC058733]|uniref:Rho termination factor N-terminal domain-containing protein n=1 Tax=Streptomyces sp. NPDC058733 TaxID=3346614 RepID=UPI0036750C82